MENLDTVLAIVLGMGVVILLFALAWYILQVVAYWKIFTKAGQAGWKSLIPVYNTYIQYKMTWHTNMFWIWLLCTIITLAFDGIIFTVGMVGAAILNVIACFKLAGAFGHGIAFGLGLFFFGPIFYLILGLGSSEYQGPQL